MSITRKTATYSAIAAVLALGVILASALIVGVAPTSSTTTASSSGTQTSQSGAGSQLLVELTDPPNVPYGTTALNLTYSSVSLLVGEPNGSGQTSVTTVTPPPDEGSGTLDLLELNNVSQTVASADLPTGTVIYSVTFVVSSISIVINGTSHPVSLATGTSSFSVDLLAASVSQGANALLIDFNPTVVSTSGGYELIPSSVGIMRPQSEIGPNDYRIGARQQLTNQDFNWFRMEQGEVSARLVSIAVSGNTTTIVVEVNNTGTTPVSLLGVDLSGNFTMSCVPVQATTTTTSASTTEATTTGSYTHTYGNGQGRGFGFMPCQAHTTVAFVPSGGSSSTVTSTTSTTSTGTCGNEQMSLASQSSWIGANSRLLSPGECLLLTYQGTITTTFGGFFGPQLTLTPSTLAGQDYILMTLATNNAQSTTSCVLPLGPTTCTPYAFRRGF